MAHAAGILFMHKGRVLLLKRSPLAADAPNTWGLPGGHIEPGESPEQAARRETWEETGKRHAGTLHHLLTSSDGFVCYGAALAKSFVPRLNDEHTAALWALINKLPSGMHPMFLELPTLLPTTKGTPP